MEKTLDVKFSNITKLPPRLYFPSCIISLMGKLFDMYFFPQTFSPLMCKPSPMFTKISKLPPYVSFLSGIFSADVKTKTPIMLNIYFVVVH